MIWGLEAHIYCDLGLEIYKR